MTSSPEVVTTAVVTNPQLADVSNPLVAAAEQNANFVTIEQVHTSAEQAGLTPAQVDAVTMEYAEVQIVAPKAAFAAVALAALMSAVARARLPTKASTGTAPQADACGACVASRAAAKQSPGDQP